MNNIKILVLEDHALTRHMLVLVLRELGYVHVYAAESGEQAFALLKAEGYFDVLICDIQMPGIDGLMFLREASEVGRIAALVISSSIAADLRLAIQQLARLSGYQVLGDLGKPFACDDLKELMAKYRPVVTLNELDAPSIYPNLEQEVFGGVLNREFVPFYQPKIDLRTQRVVGAEVLVRWSHQQHGLLAPGAFLDDVIRAGALDEMTHLIMQQALRFLKDYGLAYELHLSLNLEVSQLAMPGLVNSVRQALDEHCVPASSLILEITEVGLMRAPVATIENLVRLRLLGCGISIDDFGAGFSSLQRVCEMPCTELKLDASFTRNLVQNPRTLAAVDSVLRLALRLGINVVAEGIESHEQCLLLKNLNCPSGQGYLFSRPLAEASFKGWLATNYPLSH